MLPTPPPPPPPPPPPRGRGCFTLNAPFRPRHPPLFVVRSYLRGGVGFFPAGLARLLGEPFFLLISPWNLGAWSTRHVWPRFCFFFFFFASPACERLSDSLYFQFCLFRLPLESPGSNTLIPVSLHLWFFSYETCQLSY